MNVYILINYHLLKMYGKFDDMYYELDMFCCCEIIIMLDVDMMICIRVICTCHVMLQDTHVGVCLDDGVVTSHLQV